MKKRFIKKRQQQGSATLVPIIMLLLLGMLLLNHLQRQLDSALLVSQGERLYLQAYNQALSSLNWGLTYRWKISPLPSIAVVAGVSKTSKKTKVWPKTSTWHCESDPIQSTTACIRPSSRPGVFILKGKSELRVEQSFFYLYQYVSFDLSTTASGKNNIIAVAHSLIDFCPEPDEKFCAN